MGEDSARPETENLAIGEGVDRFVSDTRIADTADDDGNPGASRLMDFDTNEDQFLECRVSNRTRHQRSK